MKEYALQTFDGQTIFYRVWQPPKTARAVVIIVHGYAEHGGRYAHVAQHLIAHGFRVCAHDWRGHGHSGGARGSIDRFEIHAEDLQKIIDAVRDPGLPLFLLGHSAGSAVVLDYVQRFENHAAGAILSAPALYQGNGLNPAAVRLAEIMSLAVPRFKLVTLPAATLSHDPAVAEAYRADPLVYTERITARTAAELLRASKMLIARLDRVRIPLFIAHGTGDELIDPASSVVIYDRAASNDKTLQLYENYAHEIMNEIERERVLEDITTWLEARI